MPSSVLSFVQKIVMCCAFALVLSSSATSATAVLAAPLDAPIVQPNPGAFAAPVEAETPIVQPNPAAVAAPVEAETPIVQPNPAAVAASVEAEAPIVQPNPGEDVASFAEQFIGTPYRWGGTSPAGFDCTGFVMWVYSQFGVSMPHNEAGQLASGERITADDLQPGDVLVFANTYRAGLSHTGIYLGDGQFVHAADERHGVTVSALWDGYWGPRLVGASRALA